MFVYMQAYVEIILVAILVVILFNGSITGLKDFANSVLGKAFMVCLIIFFKISSMFMKCLFCFCSHFFQLLR